MTPRFAAPRLNCWARVDAVAARAKASKVRIYSRWSGKAELVVDAISYLKKPDEVPGTGPLAATLRLSVVRV